MCADSSAECPQHPRGAGIGSALFQSLRVSQRGTNSLLVVIADDGQVHHARIAGKAIVQRMAKFFHAADGFAVNLHDNVARLQPGLIRARPW